MTTKHDKVQTSKSLQRTGGWRRRAGLLALSEIGLVIGSLAVFYVFLTVLTRIYFPVGLGLSADVSPGPDAGLPGSDTVRLEVSTETSLLERLFAGEILGIQRNVQRRGANSLTWEATNVEANEWHGITKTFTVLTSTQTIYTITETLWVEDADLQLDPIVLQFYIVQKIYLPLVMRNS